LMPGRWNLPRRDSGSGRVAGGAERSEHPRKASGQGKRAAAAARAGISPIANEMNILIGHSSPERTPVELLGSCRIRGRLVPAETPRAAVAARFPLAIVFRGCSLRSAPPATLPWPLSRRGPPQLPPAQGRLEAGPTRRASGEFCRPRPASARAIIPCQRSPLPTAA
jgi:hypothetical protein